MMMKLLLGVLLFALTLAQDAETCGPHQDVKLYRTEIGASASDVFYIRDAAGDDETNLFILTSDQVLMSSLDGGTHWINENEKMPGVNTEEAPFFRAGVNKFYASADGSKLWATSFKTGFWRRSRGETTWIWQSTGTDVLLDIYQHPTDASSLLGVYRSNGCHNSSALISCKSILRASTDAGASWSKSLSQQLIQVAWSTLNPSVIFFSQHTDASGNFYQMGWSDSQLFRGTLGAGGVWQNKFMLLDKQAGMVYKHGVLIAAERPDASNGFVNLYSSTTDAASGNLDKANFRSFSDDEIQAQSFNILDFTLGSIMINVRGEETDRGDLYVSGSLDHDFELVLPDNVRGGSRADVSKLASLRGVYLANVYAPPDNKIVTGITYDNGANWDFINVPEDLKSRCNASSSSNWCGMHFLGRSNFEYGEAPYSAASATGLAMATGNVGSTLALDSPEDLATFLTRDGGVSWKEIALGDNLYAMTDRGAVIMWVPSVTETQQLSWSWDEGKSSSLCSFGTLGYQSVTSVTTSPSNDGLRFHMFTESAGKHYIVTVDFSNLADAKCTGQDTPDTPASSYETWSPIDPDGGPAGCLLGSKTVYVRRKASVQCFNVDNDLIQSDTPCKCVRDDYECDDCYERQSFWNPSSTCIPIIGPCRPQVCSPGQVYFNQTRGYRKMPGDVCTSASDDEYAPVPHVRCDSTTSQTTASLTSATQHSETSKPTETSSPSSSSPSSSSPATDTPAPSSGAGPVIAVILILVLIAGLIGGFMYLRRQPGFRARFGGRIPFVQAVEDPYSTLGELDASSNAGFDNDF